MTFGPFLSFRITDLCHTDHQTPHEVHESQDCIEGEVAIEETEKRKTTADSAMRFG